MLSRQGFDSHILRFSARLLIDGKADAKRKFVVSYFLSDDTILVTLVPELNSGKMATIVVRIIFVQLKNYLGGISTNDLPSYEH